MGSKKKDKSTSFCFKLYVIDRSGKDTSPSVHLIPLTEGKCCHTFAELTKNISGTRLNPGEETFSNPITPKEYSLFFDGCNLEWCGTPRGVGMTGNDCVLAYPKTLMSHTQLFSQVIQMTSRNSKYINFGLNTVIPEIFQVPAKLDLLYGGHESLQEEQRCKEQLQGMRDILLSAIDQSLDYWRKSSSDELKSILPLPDFSPIKSRLEAGSYQHAENCLQDIHDILLRYGKVSKIKKIRDNENTTPRMELLKSIDSVIRLFTEEYESYYQESDHCSSDEIEVTNSLANDKELSNNGETKLSETENEEKPLDRVFIVGPPRNLTGLLITEEEDMIPSMYIRAYDKETSIEGIVKTYNYHTGLKIEESLDISSENFGEFCEIDHEHKPSCLDKFFQFQINLGFDPEYNLAFRKKEIERSKNQSIDEILADIENLDNAKAKKKKNRKKKKGRKSAADETEEMDQSKDDESLAENDAEKGSKEETNEKSKNVESDRKNLNGSFETPYQWDFVYKELERQGYGTESNDKAHVDPVDLPKNRKKARKKEGRKSHENVKICASENLETGTMEEPLRNSYLSTEPLTTDETPNTTLCTNSTTEQLLGSSATDEREPEIYVPKKKKSLTIRKTNKEMLDESPKVEIQHAENTGGAKRKTKNGKTTNEQNLKSETATPILPTSPQTKYSGLSIDEIKVLENKTKTEVEDLNKRVFDNDSDAQTLIENMHSKLSKVQGRINSNEDTLHANLKREAALDDEINGLLQKISALKASKEKLVVENEQLKQDVRYLTEERRNLEEVFDKEIKGRKESKESYLKSISTLTENLRLMKIEIDAKLNIQGNDEMPKEATNSQRHESAGDSGPQNSAPSNNNMLLEFLSSQISAKEADLECPVCMEVSQVPIYTCQEQHIICSQCWDKVKIRSAGGEAECVICRSPYPQPPRHHRYMEKVAHELQQLYHMLKGIKQQSSSSS